VRAAAVFGDRLHVIFAPGAASQGLAAALAAAGLQVQEAQPIAASMEDVFIDRVAAATATVPEAA
jgi:hypothetical protein